MKRLIPRLLSLPLLPPRFSFCTPKPLNPKDKVLLIRRKLLQLDLNKTNQSPLLRSQLTNPLFQIHLSQTALNLIYTNQKRIAGFLAILSGVVGYFFGWYWAAFPGLFSLLRWMEMLENKKKVGRGVKRIYVGEDGKVGFQTMNGRKISGKLEEFGFELDERALEGKREVLGYKVTHGKEEEFRLTFTKKNSSLSNSDAMYAILMKNEELLKGFQIVENSKENEKKALFDEVAEVAKQENESKQQQKPQNNDKK